MKKEMALAVALSALLVMVSGCVEQATQEEDFCGTSTYGRCLKDSDCLVGGCSNQVCYSVNEEPPTTTCDWRDCYDNEAYGLSCQCVEDECQWD